MDEEIVLVRYYPNYRTALAWHQDLELCKQVDNRDTAYDFSLLRAEIQWIHTQSQKLFQSIGFTNGKDEPYILML